MTQQYSRDVLEKKTKSDLLEIAEELDLELESKATKSDIVEAIVAAYESTDDEVDDTDDELDDIDEPELDDDEVEEDEVEEAPVKKSTKKTTKKAASTDENTLAAKQVAALVGTDAKTIRQFFRSEASTVEAVGSGGRYEFLETDVPKIKEEFATWSSNRGKRGPGSGGGSKKSRKAAAVTEVVEEVEEIEELEEAELEDLDDDDIELED